MGSNVGYLTRSGPAQRQQKQKNKKSREKFKAPKCPPESLKTRPRDPKMAQNSPRSAPKRPQEEPKRDKKANPNHKTKKEPNQDDPKTVLDPPGAGFPKIHALQEAHLGGQNDTQINPKSIKNRSAKSRGQKNDPRRSWTRLGAILGRSWPHLRIKKK